MFNMFNLVIRLVVLVSFLSVACAECYSGGAFGNYGKWLKETDPVINAVRLEVACAALAGKGQRKFGAKEERLFCMQEKNGLKWDFSLKHVKSGQRSIDKDECMGGMKKEITCKYGGKKAYWNWEYKADPNAGYCMG